MIERMMILAIDERVTERHSNHWAVLGESIQIFSPFLNPTATRNSTKSYLGNFYLQLSLLDATTHGLKIFNTWSASSITVNRIGLNFPNDCGLQYFEFSENQY